MTYREYLCDCDEYERMIIIANLARNHPHYDCYSSSAKRQTIKDLLDTEMPKPEEDKEEDDERSNL